MNDLQEGISGETVLLVQALALKFVALQEFPALGRLRDLAVVQPSHFGHLLLLFSHCFD